MVAGVSRSIRRLMLTGSLALLSAACGDLSEFKGNFDGGIIAGNFVRSCFSADTSARLKFDPERAVYPAADQKPSERNRLTTSDGAFTDTVLEPIAALPNDPLSELDFPGPHRLRNYLLLARPSEGPLVGQDATVVVSLLDGGRIEVRVIGRTALTDEACPDEFNSEATEPSRIREYFGIFRLKR
jgi:hypothetical protein